MEYYCRHCQKVVEGKSAVKHGLHLFLCFITGGAWLFFYILALISHFHNCEECGNRLEITDRIEFFRKKPTVDNKKNPYDKYTDKELKDACFYNEVSWNQKIEKFKDVSKEELKEAWLHRQYSKKYGFYAQPPKGSEYYEG